MLATTMEVPQLPLSPTTNDFLNQVLIAASNFAVDRQHILRVEVTLKII